MLKKIIIRNCTFVKRLQTINFIGYQIVMLTLTDRVSAEILIIKSFPNKYFFSVANNIDLCYLLVAD